MTLETATRPESDELPRTTVHLAPAHEKTDAEPAGPNVFELQNFSAFYGTFQAVREIDLSVAPNRITALIGPSGSGKSTVLRWLNRMNDLIPGAHMSGQVLYHGVDLFDKRVDPVEVRRRIGMVFQKPNPFPKSIYDNVAFGPRVAGYKGNMDDLVEQSLRRAAIWDEVKDKLKQPGTALSGGQQQRLCIARAIAVSPDVILMDEPCSSLDPVATLAHRRADVGAQAELHDRHRDPQHAAGRTRLGRDGVHDDGRGPRRISRREGPDSRNLHEPPEPSDRGLRVRTVRVGGAP